MTHRATWPARSIVVVLVALGGVAPVHAQSVASRAKQVLVLYETRRSSQLVAISDRDIPNILADASTSGIDYYAEFVDPTRFMQRDYQRAFTDFLRSKYKGQRFDLLIAMGDNALAFVDATRPDLYPRTPLVFFASGPTPRRPANATGVVCRLNLGGTLTLALTLQPDLENVFVVNAADDPNRGYDAEARTQLRSFERQLAITYVSDLDKSQLEKRLSRLPARSAVYFLI